MFCKVFQCYYQIICCKGVKVELPCKTIEEKRETNFYKKKSAQPYDM